MQNFQGIKVVKKWGSEHEVFNNGTVSCWYLRLNRDCTTSLHMHEKKETSVILLNGSAVVQSGLSQCRTAQALDKTRFSAGFFHRHAAATDCDMLEIETPVDKTDLYRFQDDYGREGMPYEDFSSHVALQSGDPCFDQHGFLSIGKARLRTLNFLNAAAFTKWAKKIPPRSIVVHLKGSLISRHGIAVVKPGQANWSDNLARLLERTTAENDMQVMFVSRLGA